MCWGRGQGCGWSSGDTVGACSQVDACPGSPGFSASKHTFGPGVRHPVHACTGPWGREGVRSLRVEGRGSAWSRPCREGQGPLRPRALFSAAGPQTLLPPSPLPCCLCCHPLVEASLPRSLQGVPKPPSFLPSPALPQGPLSSGFSDSAMAPPASGRRRGLSGQLRWLLVACVLEASLTMCSLSGLPFRWW